MGKEVPALTKICLDDVARLRVEMLQHPVYTRLALTYLIRIAEYRGTRIITDVYDALAGKDGEMLLPEAVANAHGAGGDESARMRVIYDFIAGMTDRYASEFHARLHSEAPQSMFKPL